MGELGSGSVAWDEVADLYGADARSQLHELPERLIALADCRADERLVDLGCGNGLGLRRLVSARAGAGAGRLTGLDFSLAMLETARRRLAEEMGGALPLVRGDAAVLPFPDGAFDVVLASSLFQFMRYSPDVLREWRRVVAPGGRLAMSVPVGGACSGGNDAGPATPGPEVYGTLMAEFFERLPPETQQRLLAQAPVQQVPDIGQACRQAGFAETTVTPYQLTEEVDSAEAWWEQQWTHGFRGFLREFDKATLVDMRQRAIELLAPLRQPSGQILTSQPILFCVARVPAPIARTRHRGTGAPRSARLSGGAPQE